MMKVARIGKSAFLMQRPTSMLFCLMACLLGLAAGYKSSAGDYMFDDGMRVIETRLDKLEAILLHKTTAKPEETRGGAGPVVHSPMQVAAASITDPGATATNPLPDDDSEMDDGPAVKEPLNADVVACTKLHEDKDCSKCLASAVQLSCTDFCNGCKMRQVRMRRRRRIGRKHG